MAKTLHDLFSDFVGSAKEIGDSSNHDGAGFLFNPQTRNEILEVFEGDFKGRLATLKQLSLKDNELTTIVTTCERIADIAGLATIHYKKIESERRRALIEFWREKFKPSEREKLASVALELKRRLLSLKTKSESTRHQKNFRNSTADLAATASHVEGTVVPSPPAGSTALTNQQFSDLGSNFGHRARGFLRGVEPDFAVSVHAAVIRSVWLEDVQRKLLEGNRVVLVSSLIADGLTTALMQLAHQEVQKNGAVSMFSSPGQFANENALAPRHLVILDNCVRANTIPDWIAHASAGNPDFQLVIGTKRYAKASVERRLSDLGLPYLVCDLPEFDSTATEQLVALIKKFDAADNPSLNLSVLMNQTFNDPRQKQGKLFPAMFEATRGEGLEQRFSRMATSLDTNSPLLLGIGFVAHTNVISDATKSQIDLPSASFVKLVFQVAIDSEDIAAGSQIASEIANLPSIYEGEFKRLAGGAISVRHPSIAHILTRHIFGSSPNVGKSQVPARLYKWQNYRWMIVARLRERPLRGNWEYFLSQSFAVLATERIKYDEVQLSHATHFLTCIIVELESVMALNDAPAGIKVHAFVATANCLSLKSDCVSEGKDDLRRRATLLLASALALDQSSKMLAKVSATLERIGQIDGRQAKVTIAGGVEVDWKALRKMSADLAEQSGNFEEADRSALIFLQGQISRIPRGVRFCTATELQKIGDSCQKVDFLHSEKCHSFRLSCLLSLVREVLRRVQGNIRQDGSVYLAWDRVPDGPFDAPFMSTKASVIRELWRELNRLHELNLIETTVAPDQIKRQVLSSISDWLTFVNATGNQINWQIDETRLCNLLNSGQISELANAFPKE